MKKHSLPESSPAAPAMSGASPESRAQVQPIVRPLSRGGYTTDLEMLGDYFRQIEVRNVLIAESIQRAEDIAEMHAWERRIAGGIDKAHPKKGQSLLLEKFRKLKLTPDERLIVSCFCYFGSKPEERAGILDVLSVVCLNDRIKMIKLRSFLNKSTKLYDAGLLKISIDQPPFHHDVQIKLGAEVQESLWGRENRNVKTTLPLRSFTNKIKHPQFASSPRAVYQALSRYVVGQENAKRTLSVAVYNHYLRINGRSDIAKANIMLAGPTGCGKTYLVEIIAKLLDVPLVIADASQYSETGYMGRDVEEILIDLLLSTGNNRSKAARGIIFLDEIDKIAAAYDNGHHRSNRDVSGEAVQAELLKLIEGGKCASNPFDISNVLFIAGGAFSGIIQQRISLRNKATIGFGVESLGSMGKQTKGPGLEEFINYGMLPELMGRFQVRVLLDSLDMCALRKIMTEPENAVIKQYQRLFDANGIKLRVTDEAVDLMVNQAAAMKTGARALKSVAEDTLNPLMFEHFGRGRGSLVVNGSMVQQVSGRV